MRCRVADDSQTIQPITWRNAKGQSSELIRSADQGVAVAYSQEISQLRSQLADSERRRQAEVQLARQEGVAEGVSQVEKQAAGELQAAMERVAATLSDLAQTKRKVRVDAEIELLKLSVAIARRIVHREIQLDAEALSGVVHAALQKLQSRETSRVRVFPAGADMVRAALDRFGAPPALEVFPDPSLRPGDLIFETGMGQLDASVETQLQEIQRGLTDRLALPK
jgi:flagellar assembly protein FliH